MKPHPPKQSIIWIQLILCLAIGATISVMMGQDANFDLRNYHIYTPYAVLHGRFDVDILPAGAQTTINPTLDFFYYGLAMGPLAHFPRVLAAVMGLWYGLLIFVTLRLASRLFGNFPKPERPFLIALGTLTAVTGSVVFSQIGLTLNDIPVGMMILAGFLFTLKAIDAPKPKFPDKRSLVTAGLLFGLSAGLKLTGIIYAPALCLALLVVMPPRIWLRASTFFSAGWLAGFIPPFGWWAWFLWARFLNPFFPFFNNIFHSPYIIPRSYLDGQYRPHDIWHWLFYPFFWAWRVKSNVVIEPAFRDPRMAIAYLALFALAVPFLIKIIYHLVGKKQNHAKNSVEFAPAQKLMLAFLVLSYLGWVLTFCIIRYAVAIEVMSVLGTIIVLQPLARQLSPHSARRTAVIFTVLTCAMSLGLTHYMYWERTGYGDKVFDVDMSWAKPDTLFVTVGRPVAYLAAFVPPEAHTRMIDSGITSAQHDWPLGKRASHMLKTNPGPIIVLLTDDITMRFLQFMPLRGLAMKADTCRTVQSNLDLDLPVKQPIYACEVLPTHSFLME